LLPDVPVISSAVTDLIKKYWKEEGWSTDVTLDAKDPIWEEWWMGASATHKMCPRMFALMSAVGVDNIEKEVFPAETLWLFETGKAYHRMFQEKILPSFPRGTLLGRWKKINKETDKIEEYTNFQNKVPKGVLLERGWGPKPEGDGWQYDEPKLRIPGYRVVVKIDAILDSIETDGLEVIEIKTEKSDAKDMLNPRLGGRPRDKHVEQVHVGMWATGIQRGRIIYGFKGERSMSSSIIEHVVERDEKIIDQLKTRAVYCIEAVRKIDKVRDKAIIDVCAEMHGPDEHVLPLEDLLPEIQGEVRKSMKVVAEEMPRLPECQMKSKGKPKYCNGRDLCFGVRKRKKKAK
jgi:hypothetical protein